VTRAHVPLLGYVYVAFAIPALVLDDEHPRTATALFTLAGFAFLWFLGSLRAKLIRYDPDGFFASVVVLGGASFLALQTIALGLRAAAVAATAAASAATVVVGSSLAALRARKVPKWFGWLGVAGGVAVLVVGVVEAATEWTLAGSTVWASQMGFMIWVVVTATYLLRRS
jgi:hypothetical protein